MKIKRVRVNNRKKCLEIGTAKGTFSLPFSKLRLKPTARDKIIWIIIDPELSCEALTYRLSSGKEDSVPLDAFLDFNRDPGYLKMITLHSLTVEALNAFRTCGMSKHEVVRRMNTSPSQLYRLLDTSNQRKSVDEMLKLLTVLDCDISWTVKQKAA